MEGIVGAAGRLMTQTWALSPYWVLAGKLMFGNKQGGRELFHTRLLLAVGLPGLPQQLLYLAFVRWHR